MNLGISPGKAVNAPFKWEPKGDKDGTYFVAVSISDESGTRRFEFKKEFQLAGGKQAAKLAEWKEYDNALKKLLSRYNANMSSRKTSKKSLNARIALTRLALLLSELKSAITGQRIG